MELLSAKEGSAARNWMLSSLVWLLIGMIWGALETLQWVWPNELNWGIFHLGRTRAMHVSTVLFGWVSMASVGFLLYAVPRLCNVKLHDERNANLVMWVWNLVIVLGNITLLLGYTQGREYAEFIWALDVLVVLGLLLLGWNLLETIWHRKERRLYASVWYLTAAVLWTAVVYPFGNAMWDIPRMIRADSLDIVGQLQAFISVGTPAYQIAQGGALSGVEDAVLNWWYGHNVIGMWFTPLAVGILYYIVPATTKNPLFSHKLSMLGFWTLLAFYPLTGSHHILQAPIPEWLKDLGSITSALMIIPVVTALTNFYMTPRLPRMRMGAFFENIPFKFAITSALFYLIVCLQGPLQATQWWNWYIHFTQWEPGHAHLALAGFASFAAIGGIYYAIPRITGHELYSRYLANWHYWLMTIGVVGFFLSFTISGLIQSNSFILGTAFGTIAANLKIYVAVRSLFGILIFLSQFLFLYNILQTVRGKQPVADEIGLRAEDFEKLVFRGAIRKPEPAEEPSSAKASVAKENAPEVGAGR